MAYGLSRWDAKQPDFGLLRPREGRCECCKLLLLALRYPPATADAGRHECAGSDTRTTAPACNHNHVRHPEVICSALSTKLDACHSLRYRRIWSQRPFDYRSRSHRRLLSLRQAYTAAASKMAAVRLASGYVLHAMSSAAQLALPALQRSMTVPTTGILCEMGKAPAGCRSSA